MLFGKLNAVVLLASDAEPNPLAFEVDLALWTLIIFVGLFLVLTKFAWKPIIEGLNQREESIASNIDSAARVQEEASAKLKEYDDKLAGAQDEATAIIAEAKQDALAAKDKIVSEAKDEANREREKAFADIASAKDAAVRELAEKSVDSAVSLAGNIVGRSLNKNDHQNLIDQAVERFKNSSGA